jgi:hypothetical protein
MRRLRVGILDLVTNEVPMRTWYGWVMNANLSNILDLIRRELGPAYGYMPEGALTHDHNAYLKSSGPQTISKALLGSSTSRAAVVVEQPA